MVRGESSIRAAVARRPGRLPFSRWGWKIWTLRCRRRVRVRRAVRARAGREDLCLVRGRLPAEASATSGGALWVLRHSEVFSTPVPPAAFGCPHRRVEVAFLVVWRVHLLGAWMVDAVGWRRARRLLGRATPFRRRSNRRVGGRNRGGSSRLFWGFGDRLLLWDQGLFRHRGPKLWPVVLPSAECDGRHLGGQGQWRPLSVAFYRLDDQRPSSCTTGTGTPFPARNWAPVTRSAWPP